MIALSYPASAYQLVEAFHHHIIKPALASGFVHDMVSIPYKLLMLHGIAHQALVVHIVLHFRDRGVLDREVLTTELDITDRQLDQYLEELIRHGLTQRITTTQEHYGYDMAKLCYWPEAGEFIEEATASTKEAD